MPFSFGPQWAGPPPGNFHTGLSLMEIVMSYQLYEYEKQAWLKRHPEATPAQIMRAFKAIARKLGI